MHEITGTQSQLTKTECMFSSALNPPNDRGGTLLACLGLQSKQSSTNSTAILFKHSHYFLLWNIAGFLRMLPVCNPLGGNHNGKQAAGYGNRVLSSVHYQAQHLAHKSTKHTTRAGSSELA